MRKLACIAVVLAIAAPAYADVDPQILDAIRKVKPSDYPSANAATVLNAQEIKYERDGDKRSGRVARVKKPVIAQIEGAAVGGGLAISAGADIRIATPEARFGMPTARTLGNCLSMRSYAMFVDLFGASRLKEIVFTARLISAEEALAAGYVHQIVPAHDIEKYVRELATKVAAHAPLTLWATKEALRRIQDARALPDGDDIVRKVYGSDDFKEGVRAFVEKRAPRWAGK